MTTQLQEDGNAHGVPSATIDYHEEAGMPMKKPPHPGDLI
jgi:hypothetical protein